VQSVLLVTFPFFALVLAGFWAAWRGILPLAAISGLNAYVLYFALPCLLFRFGASTPIATLLDPVTLTVYALCGLAIVAFTVAMTLSRRLGWVDASLGALVAAFPNTGFMGVPLLVALFGPKAAGTVIQTIMVDMLITTSLCVAISRLGRAQDNSFGAAIWHALQGVFSNPMPWAILAGIAAAAIKAEIPADTMASLGTFLSPLNKSMALLADSASPVALFTIGAVLARAQLAQARPPENAAAKAAAATGLSTPDHGWRAALPVALIKLILHPLLVAFSLVLARQLGFEVDPFVMVVLIAAAALPSASNVSLLAERFGADNGRIARIILLSTVMAFFTFSALVALLKT
jgi:malonate transporter and related proteins